MRDGTAVFARTGQREGLFLRSRPTGASAPALSREIIGALMDFPFTSAIPRKRSVATREPGHVGRQEVQSQSAPPVAYAKMNAVALVHHLRIRAKWSHESMGLTRVRFATLPLQSNCFRVAYGAPWKAVGNSYSLALGKARLPSIQLAIDRPLFVYRTMEFNNFRNMA